MRQLSTRGGRCVLRPERKYALCAHAHMVATPARGTEGMYLQHRFGSSRLVRLLQDWAQVDGESPRQDVAERLSHWLSAADAVQLDGSLHAIESYPAQTKLSGQAVDTREVGDLINQTKAELTDLITAKVAAKVMPNGTRSDTPKAVLSAASERHHMDASLQGNLDAEDARVEAQYAPHYQRYQSLQKQMESTLMALRTQVRQKLSKGSPSLRQLVALDAVMVQMLGTREQKLWAAVPVYLERRLTHWRQHHERTLAASGQEDDPIRWRQAGGWIHAFQHDMREMLLAELNLRLQPILGLMEAADHENNGASRDEKSKSP